MVDLEQQRLVRLDDQRSTGHGYLASGQFSSGPIGRDGAAWPATRSGDSSLARTIRPAGAATCAIGSLVMSKRTSPCGGCNRTASSGVLRLCTAGGDRPVPTVSPPAESCVAARASRRKALPCGRCRMHAFGPWCRGVGAFGGVPALATVSGGERVVLHRPSQLFLHHRCRDPV